MHLHGHDFAVLQVSTTPYIGKLDPKTDNPARRDVILLPKGGFVLIAFKTDNPGTWLMHCHIAVHASSGLGLQIMERQVSYVHSVCPLFGCNHDKFITEHLINYLD